MKRGRHATGIGKYILLARALRTRGLFRLPARFALGMVARMRGEKLTLHDGRVYVNTFHAPFPSPSYDRSIEGFVELSRGAMRPFSAYLSVTDRCPYRCAYCSNGRAAPGRDPSAADLSRLAGDLQDAGTVCIGFTGGEPLVRADLEEIVARIDPRSYTLLFTSGRGLDASRAAALRKAGLVMAAVSLDSHVPSAHDASRGRAGVFDAAVAGIRNAVGAGIYTAVSMVMSRDMLFSGMKYEFVRYAASLGAHEIRVLAPSPAGRLLDARYGAFGDAERGAIVAFQREINRDPSLPKIMSLVEVGSDGRYGCVAGRMHLYVAASGDVFPCDFVPLSFGNAYREPFAEIYRRMGECLDAPNCGCLNTILYKDMAVAAGRGYPVRDPDCIRNMLAPVGDLPVPPLFRSLRKGGYTR